MDLSASWVYVGPLFGHPILMSGVGIVATFANWPLNIFVFLLERVVGKGSSNEILTP